MSQDGLKQVLGRAIVDEEFRTLLFSNPAEALRGFDLTDQELTGLQNTSREDFDKMKSEVEERMSRAGVGLGAISSEAFLKITGGFR